MTKELIEQAAGAPAPCGGAPAGVQKEPAPVGAAALEGDWLVQLDTGSLKLRLIHTFALRKRRPPQAAFLTNGRWVTRPKRTRTWSRLSGAPG